MQTMPVWQATVILVAGFYLLAKSSSWLVDGAVGIAERLSVPKLLIGIVLVGFATTAPEFAVSVLSAIRGKAEMALGNAVGSVIVDDGVALALVGFFAAAPVAVSGRVLKLAACFLILIDVVCFIFVAIPSPAVVDGVETVTHTLSRGEGVALLALFFAYVAFVIWDRRRRPVPEEDVSLELKESEKPAASRSLPALFGLFLLGVVVIIFASHFVVESAIRIAGAIGVPNVVIALTVVAIGTSLPEIATCIAAARAGHGSLAVGDIVGADILNIAWIAGASATVNPLTLTRTEAFFMFPSMMVMVLTVLVALLVTRKMTKWLGAVLLTEYVGYLGVMIYLFLIAGTGELPPH